MRVLIVEDEPNLGRQLRATLEGAGYAVDLATDGEDGHYLGSTESYDAIILDLGLPEVDGLTVLERWREARADGRRAPPSHRHKQNLSPPPPPPGPAGGGGAAAPRRVAEGRAQD